MMMDFVVVSIVDLFNNQINLIIMLYLINKKIYKEKILINIVIYIII
jgi:hypothetical protein